MSRHNEEVVRLFLTELTGRNSNSASACVHAQAKLCQGKDEALEAVGL
jgi:hypothetical protein